MTGIFFITFLVKDVEDKASMVMGAVLLKSTKDEKVARSEQPTLKEYNEQYFRPSKLIVLNVNKNSQDLIKQFRGKKPEEVILPSEVLKTPQDTVINYFSILREAENMIEGKYGGCGTVGNSKIPYPIAYNFLSKSYKEKMDYKSFLKSFEGIAHINLIKLKNVTNENTPSGQIRYFIELETLEPSEKGSTYFAYYFGDLYIEKEGESFRIANVELGSEDFLCAPYHGWRYAAEAYVDVTYGGWCKLIEERLPTVQEGYTKNITIKGTDGKEYRFEFVQLTNGIDIEVGQYVREKESVWKAIKLDPEKCLENR
jgi:hypothetical protein